MYEYGVCDPDPLSFLQIPFPRYEHAHDIGEAVLALGDVLLALRLPYSENIERFPLACAMLTGTLAEALAR